MFRLISSRKTMLKRVWVVSLLGFHIVAPVALAAGPSLDSSQQAPQLGKPNRQQQLDSPTAGSSSRIIASRDNIPVPPPEHLVDRLNVKDFGAKGNGQSDDSAAFAAAISAQHIRLSGGVMPCIYLPASIYVLKDTSLPTIDGPGCIEGDGALHTVIKIDPTYKGDVFSFSDAWPRDSLPFNGVTANPETQRGGTILREFSIIGNRSTTETQNAIVFYDRDEFVELEDLDIEYVKGRALAFGLTKNLAQAFIQESRINRLRLLNDGAAGIPVVEFSGAGPAGAEGSGEIDVDNMDIYANYGPGLVIHNSSKAHLATMRFRNLRIEGLENDPTHVGADLLAIGDTELTGVVDGLVFRETELLNPYAGGAALRIAATTAASMPYDLDFEGVIGGGAPLGKGLVISAGRAMRFNFTDIYTEGTEITVGAAPLVGPQISITGQGGRETSWTYNVDPSSVRDIISTPLRIGNPAEAETLSLALTGENGPMSQGGRVGAGAIDLEASDRARGYSASGSESALLAGSHNTASGEESSVIGGADNIASGKGGAIVGSSFASDRGRIYSQAYASGGPDGAGSSQAGRQAMYARGSRLMRLTAGGAGPSSALSPIMNIPSNSAFNVSVRLVAIDRTAPGNYFAETIPAALLTRGHAASSTRIIFGRTDIVSTGSGVGAQATATADTRNGGLNLTFTPPAGSDTWDAFADVASAEVR